jgi:hypothetical protein
MITNGTLAFTVMWVGAVLTLAGTLPYAVATARSQVRPERVTWLIWTLASATVLAGQLLGGAPLSAWLLTAAAGLGPLLVIVASLVNRELGWRWSPVNLACLGVAAVGWLVWVLSGDALLAVVMGVLVNTAATIPTVLNGLHDGEHEQYLPYVTTGVAGVLTLLIIPWPWTWLDALYAGHIAVLCALIIGAIHLGRQRAGVVAASQEAW